MAIEDASAQSTEEIKAKKALEEAEARAAKLQIDLDRCNLVRADAQRATMHQAAVSVVLADEMKRAGLAIPDGLASPEVAISWARRIKERQAIVEGSQDGPQAEPPPSPPTRRPATPTPRKRCCRYCSKGIPCGNSCISASKTCHQPPGCAC